LTILIDNMTDLLVKQYSLFYSISRSLENLKKIGKNNYSAAKIRSRMSVLKDTWTQCVQTHSLLLQAIPETKRESFDYFKNYLFDVHEDVYQDTLDYMTECLEEIEPIVSSPSSNHRKCESTSAL
jgi:hypothetical protein